MVEKGKYGILIEVIILNNKKLVSNYIYSVAYQLLIVISPFIVTPYLARVLGLELLSINTLTANLVQWFVIFGIMGVNHYGNREIARVRDDKQDRSRTFFEIFTMQLISMIISAIAYYIFAAYVYPEYTVYVWVQGVTLLSVSLDITWFFYGMEDFKKASLRNMFVKILGIGLIFGFVNGKEDLMLFVLINVCTGVLGQLIMWIQLRQYIHFTKVSVAGVKRHIKPNLALFVPQIATSVYTLLDISMIGILYDNQTHATLYEQTQKFVKMFLFFITSIGSIMLPRISHTFGKGKHEEVANYLRITLRFAMYLSIPMVFGIVGMIQDFVPWFFDSPDFDPVGLMIICTSPIIIFIALSNVYGTQYMIPTGLTKEYSTSVVAGAVINFIINLVLIPMYGAYGAIIASVCAEFCVTLIQWVLVRKQIPAKLNIHDVYRYVIAGSIMGYSVHLVGNSLGSSLTTNLIQVVVGGSLYVLLCFVLRDPFQQSILNKVLKRGG